MRAVVVKPIWGSKNSWSLSPNGRTKGQSILCNITVEIVGDGADGFHMVMSPAGFFTADTWHQTKEEAIETALETFGIGDDQWID